LRSGNAVGHINKVKLRRARLVLGLVIFGGSTFPVSIKATQEKHPAMYMSQKRVIFCDPTWCSCRRLI